MGANKITILIHVSFRSYPLTLIAAIAKTVIKIVIISMINFTVTTICSFAEGKCPSPNITNGRAKITGRNQLGAVAKYSCSKGYSLEGVETRVSLAFHQALIPHMKNNLTRVQNCAVSILAEDIYITGIHKAYCAFFT